MFLNLALLYEGYAQGRHTVLTLPAIQLARWLDEVWAEGILPSPDADSAASRARGLLRNPSETAGGGAYGIAPSGLDPGLDPGPPAPFTLDRGPLARRQDGGDDVPIAFTWDHLIYAYLIEATGAFDILAEVGRRLVAGESLGRLGPDSIAWLRNTEELFFRDPPLYSVAGIVSTWRPSASVARRNVYWRMFGMDLPHQIPAGWPGSGAPDSWKKSAGPGVNTDFVAKMTELLRQVWLGIENQNNQVGPNAADPDYISLLCNALRDMLVNRRQAGLLAREEFTYVSSMSWFELTLLDNVGGADVNSPIVQDLQARATTPEQRLTMLAEKVGLKPAPRARELFLLARPMSIFVRQIENGAYSETDQARALYDGSVPELLNEMSRIVNLWQSATGYRIKDRPIGTGPGTLQSAQPLRTPTPAGASASASLSAGNGARSE